MRLLLAVIVYFLVPLPAAAHMVVLPAESAAGGWERYALLVPTEKASPTVRVQVVLPVGMEIVAVESVPGWQGVYKPFPIGAATVQWHGGRIPKDEFVSFEFLAWNPPAARTVSWVATQWYEDGSSDQCGGVGDEAHASQTVLRAREQGGDRQKRRHLGAHHAHEGTAPASAGTGSEVIVIGRIVPTDDDGTSFQLQPDTGQDAYVLAAPLHVKPTTLSLDDLAGQRVRVTGTVAQENGSQVLRPTAIVEEHDHTRAPHDGVVGMAGDRHLELVVTTRGEIRVYLLDAFLSAVDARGVTGEVVIQTRDGAKRSAALRAGPERGLLVVEGERRRPEDDDITATLDIGAEQVRMTLPFRPDADQQGFEHHPH